MNRRERKRQKPDVMVNNLGTIVTLSPLSGSASEWIANNVQRDGGMVIAESRYAVDIIQGMLDHGLRVKAA